MIRKNNDVDIMVRRGGIYLVDLRGRVGSEQGGLRPVVVMQNDKGNKFSPTTIICPLTSKTKSMDVTHVMLSPNDCGILQSSIVLCEQVRVIDKSRIRKEVGHIIAEDKLIDIEKKIMLSFGITARKRTKKENRRV